MFDSEHSTCLFHDEGHYHIETSPLIGRAIQWTSFYIMGTQVMEELRHNKLRENIRLSRSHLVQLFDKCSITKLFSQILQNFRGNICGGFFFSQKSWHRWCFLVNFMQFLKMDFYRIPTNFA